MWTTVDTTHRVCTSWSGCEFSVSNIYIYIYKHARFNLLCELVFIWQCLNNLVVSRTGRSSVQASVSLHIRASRWAVERWGQTRCRGVADHRLVLFLGSCNYKQCNGDSWGGRCQQRHQISISRHGVNTPEVRGGGGHQDKIPSNVSLIIIILCTEARRVSGVRTQQIPLQ